MAGPLTLIATLAGGYLVARRTLDPVSLCLPERVCAARLVLAFGRQKNMGTARAFGLVPRIDRLPGRGRVSQCLLGERRRCDTAGRVALLQVDRRLLSAQANPQRQPGESQRRLSPLLCPRSHVIKPKAFFAAPLYSGDCISISRDAARWNSCCS